MGSHPVVVCNVINVFKSLVTITIHGFNREGGVQHSALSPTIADREGGVHLMRCILQRAFNKCATFIYIEYFYYKATIITIAN